MTVPQPPAVSTALPAGQTDSASTEPPPAEPPALHRIPVPATGYYYVHPPRAAEAAGGPAPALVVCHGFAQTPTEFAAETTPLVPEEFAHVIPVGFNQQVSMRSRKITYSWLSSFEKWDSIERNSQFLADMIARLGEQNIVDPRRVFLLGFSQGSSVVYRFAQRFPQLAAGVISVCSDLPKDVAENLEPLRRVPFLVAWGLKDPFTVYAKPDEAAATLKEAGVDVETHAFDAPHVIPPQFGPPVQTWMRTRLEALSSDRSRD